jgi:MFS family permease
MNPEHGAPGPWWKGLDRTMWWVLIVSALGWLFDVMDQRIFTISRSPALDELLSVRLTGTMSTEDLARALGIDVDPASAHRIEEPEDPRGRATLVIPLAGKEPLRLPVVRSPSGETRVLPTPQRNQEIGRIATAVFLAGWATGGLLFGILGDKWGRAFTMVLTILVYSVFTGLSALSVGWIDYSIYRFLTGMGVGGEFAAGAALVAEVMPARARPYALGLLQAFSALGNILGSFLGKVVLPPANPAEEFGGWRTLYWIGILPAILVLVIRSRLKEPEKWQAAKESAGDLIGKQLGAFGDLFRPPWMRSTFFGVLFAVSGVLGLWGIGFWSFELIRSLDIDLAEKDAVVGSATMLQDVGAFLGIAAITIFTQGAPRTRAVPYMLGLLASAGAAVGALLLGAGTRDHGAATAVLGIACAAGLYFILVLAGTLLGGLGRRASFALAFAAAFAATIMVFRDMTRPEQVYWMIPILGFSTLLCFGMFAIYFPELYPTRLRTTGTGFCYNVARYLAAAGLFIQSELGRQGLDLRTVAQVFAVIYVVGFLAAWFAPETKDRPLAEG